MPKAIPKVVIVDKGKRVVSRTIKVLTVDGVEITSDDMDLLDALRDTDGFCTFVRGASVSTKRRDRLEAAGLCTHSARGSLYGTEKLKKNLDAIEAAFLD